MKKFVYGGGFFLAIVCLVAGFCISYRKGAADTSRQKKTTEAAAAGAVSPLNSHALENDSKAEVGYVLRAENDRVVVYCADGTTMFEYTDIFISDLPYDLQSEIRNGKQISGISQLYSFLENYSS